VRGSSLQLRSVVAAATAIVLALVLVGVGVDLLVSRHLHRSLDRNLRDRAVQVAQLSVSAPALLTTPGALDSPLGGTQLSVVVLDRRGRIVARSLSLGGRVLPTGPFVKAAIARGQAGYANVTTGGERMRVYAAPLANFGGPAAGGAVVIAASTHELDRTLGSLHLFIVGSAAAAAVLAALAVFLLLRRALRPLGQAGAREAFLQTLRSVIDVKGQRVSARDRLYLLRDMPTLIVWGERDHTIPLAHGRWAHEAAPGTIRGDYALVGLRNLVHASDAPETAAAEIALWFPDGVVAYTRDLERWMTDEGAPS
jgi:pimeloyl-ACP methyl ester carboxylesterase